MESFLNKIYLLQRKSRILLRLPINCCNCFLFLVPKSSEIEDILLTLVLAYFNFHVNSIKFKYTHAYFLPIITCSKNELSSKRFRWDFLEFLKIHPQNLIYLDSISGQEGFNQFLGPCICTLHKKTDNSWEILTQSNEIMCTMDLSSLGDEFTNMCFKFNLPYDELLSNIIDSLLKIRAQVDTFAHNTKSISLSPKHITSSDKFVRTELINCKKLPVNTHLNEITIVDFESFNFGDLHVFYSSVFPYSYFNNKVDIINQVLRHLIYRDFNVFIGIFSLTKEEEICNDIIFILKIIMDQHLIIWIIILHLIYIRSDLGLEAVQLDCSKIQCDDMILIQLFHPTNTKNCIYSFFKIFNKLIHTFKEIIVKNMSAPRISFPLTSFEDFLFQSKVIQVIYPLGEDDVYLLFQRYFSSLFFREHHHISLIESYFLEKYTGYLSDIDSIKREKSAFNPKNQLCQTTGLQKHSNVDWKRLRRRYKRVKINDIEYILDMELIANYTNTFQHGGYMQDIGRLPVVLIFGKYLPLRTTKNYEQILKELFFYILALLDGLIFDQYILIYFHSGVTPHHLPNQQWIRQFYEMINEKMKKSLIDLYIVEPTQWVKAMLKLSKPFISKKFFHKIKYMSSIAELFRKVRLDSNVIPVDILNTRSCKLQKGRKNLK